MTPSRCCARWPSGPTPSRRRVRWSFVRHWGDARLIMIDSRAGRVLDEQRRRMVDDDEFAWIEAAMQRAAAEGVQHLIIGTSLPWLLPHAIHKLERWNETLNVRHDGRVAGPAGREAAAGGRPGALGRVRETPSSGWAAR